MRTFKSIGFVVIFVIALAACGGGAEYALVCNIDTESYGFEISGEEGPMQVQTQGESTQSQYSASGALEKVTVEVDRTLTYEQSGHAYDIVGTIEVDFRSDSVSYDITSSGETFDAPQTCQK